MQKRIRNLFIFQNEYDRFVGCGRYFTTSADDPRLENGYTIADPNVGHLSNVTTAASLLAKESFDTDQEVYESKDDPASLYLGDSMGLAYLLALIHRSRSTIWEKTGKSFDIWCTGTIDVAGDRPMLNNVYRNLFEIKLRAFLADDKDHLFIVPVANIEPKYQPLFRQQHVTALSLDQVPNSSLQEIVDRKTIVKVHGNELADLVNAIFETSSEESVTTLPSPRLKRLKVISIAVVLVILLVLLGLGVGVIPLIKWKNRFKRLTIRELQLEVTTVHAMYERIKHDPHHPDTSEVAKSAFEGGRKLLRLDDTNLDLGERILKYQCATLAFVIAASLEYNSVTVSNTQPEYTTVKNYVKRAIESGETGMNLIEEVERLNSEDDKYGQQLLDWIENGNMKKQMTYELAKAFTIKFQTGDDTNSALREVERLLNGHSLASWCDYLKKDPPEDDPHLKEVLSHIHYRCKKTSSLPEKPGVKSRKYC